MARILWTFLNSETKCNELNFDSKVTVYREVFLIGYTSRRADLIINCANKVIFVVEYKTTESAKSKVRGEKQLSSTCTNLLNAVHEKNSKQQREMNNDGKEYMYVYCILVTRRYPPNSTKQLNEVRLKRKNYKVLKMNLDEVIGMGT